MKRSTLFVILTLFLTLQAFAYKQQSINITVNGPGNTTIPRQGNTTMPAKEKPVPVGWANGDVINDHLAVFFIGLELSNEGYCLETIC